MSTAVHTPRTSGSVSFPESLYEAIIIPYPSSNAGHPVGKPLLKYVRPFIPDTMISLYPLSVVSPMLIVGESGIFIISFSPIAVLSETTYVVFVLFAFRTAPEASSPYATAR